MRGCVGGSRAVSSCVRPHRSGPGSSTAWPGRIRRGPGRGPGGARRRSLRRLARGLGHRSPRPPAGAPRCVCPRLQASPSSSDRAAPGIGEGQASRSLLAAKLGPRVHDPHARVRSWSGERVPRIVEKDEIRRAGAHMTGGAAVRELHRPRGTRHRPRSSTRIPRRRPPYRTQWGA